MIRRFREVMAGQRVSQIDLARQVGMSREQLTRILNGHKPATFTEAVDIAAALRLDLAAVVREAEQSQPVPSRVPVEAEVADLILQADLEVEEQREANRPHPCG